MRVRNFGFIGLSSFIVLLLLSYVSPQTKANSGKSPLKTVADIPLPGPAVRFDYQSLDATSGRLYIAHMNADHLVVFDTATRKLVANIGGFARVHGVWAVPELARLFASVTGDHEVAAVDTQTLRTVAKVGPINYPDGITYAPGPKRFFVSDEHGNTDAVIDAQTNSLIKKIDLGGGAGNTVYDPTSKRILVAVHEKNDLVAIDPNDSIELTELGHASLGALGWGFQLPVGLSTRMQEISKSRAPLLAGQPSWFACLSRLEDEIQCADWRLIFSESSGVLSRLKSNDRLFPTAQKGALYG